jgi:fructokinase
LETYISGPSFSRDYKSVTGIEMTAELIVERMRDGESDAMRCFERYIGALCRGLATVINILDPDVIVLGGGMSNISELYDAIPNSISDQIFTDVFDTPIKQAVHGDSSGVRGAAWLWA